jgi:hypothetical protein
LAAAQYGPHRWSAGDRDADHTDAFRGTTFDVRDLTGSRFVDCDLSGVKVVDSWLVGVDLRVNDVDVTAYVDAELDRRHPERVQLRELRDANGFRALWSTIEKLWAEVAIRVERLPESARQARVGGEWSFVETMRHLVYCTDSWASRPVLDQERPYDRLALPQTAYPATAATDLGMDIDAHPTYDEVMVVRADRLALMRRLVDGLTDAELGRMCARSPAPGYPEGDRSVAECLAVVMEEECEHYRYATRDLARLEAAAAASDGASAD